MWMSRRQLGTQIWVESYGGGVCVCVCARARAPWVEYCCISNTSKNICHLHLTSMKRFVWKLCVDCMYTLLFVMFQGDLHYSVYTLQRCYDETNEKPTDPGRRLNESLFTCTGSSYLLSSQHVREVENKKLQSFWPYTKNKASTSRHLRT